MMFAGWLVGLAFGSAMIGIVAVAAASSNPLLLIFVLIQTFFLVFAAYGFFYVVARMALAGPAGTTIPSLTAPNPLPDNPTELFARGFSIGLTALLNAVGIFGALAGLGLPSGQLLGWTIAGWAFIVTSLAAIPTVSRNRVYQGFLGWSGWIFPMSLLATVFGFIWFVINFPVALVSGLMGGGWPFRLDWTTGAIETVGGITGFFSIPTAAGGTVGHFVFVLAPFGSNPALFQQAFSITAPPAALNVPMHETGHTLDYTAFSGFRVLWALIDQLILNNPINAYSELTADSHVPNVGRLQVRVWS